MMVELGWNINELDFWLLKKNCRRNILFKPLLYRRKIGFEFINWIKLGCKLDKPGFYSCQGKLKTLPLWKNWFVLVSISITLHPSGHPYWKACEMNNSEMASSLSGNGASITGFNDERKITLAFWFILEPISEHSNNFTPLIQACSKGSFNVIRTIHRHYPEHFKDDSVCWDVFAEATQTRKVFSLLNLLDPRCKVNLWIDSDSNRSSV